MKPIFIKSVDSQTEKFAMRNPDGTGINLTFWPATDHVIIGSCWNHLDGQQIEEAESIDAMNNAVLIISRPVAAL